MPQISRREQVELDELLSDIYRGIETLPDHRTEGGGSYIITRSDPTREQSPIIGRAYVREFEVPESSPLVQRHKQAIKAAGQQQQQPQRSTLKRQTGGGSQTPDLRNSNSRANNPASPQPYQSLAAFTKAHPVTGPPSSTATPENKRRVRIVDHPEKLAKGYSSASDDEQGEEDEDYALNDYYNEPPAANQFDSVYVSTSPKKKRQTTGGGAGKGKEKVKYVNTNKLIYHQEREADFDGDERESRRRHERRASDSENEDDDDIDGVTRTEYYHTTWLDRQLGRASKRRSSKELNERQVKEKAMIEELKRSLKNGAITLKQSLKGKRNAPNNRARASDIFDDLDNNNNNSFDSTTNQPDWNSTDPYNSREQAQVVKTGIATLPRNHHHHHHHKKTPNAGQQNGGGKKYEQKTTYWSQTLSPKSKGNYYQSQRVEQQERQHLPTRQPRQQQQQQQNFVKQTPEQHQSTSFNTSIKQPVQEVQARSQMQATNYPDNNSNQAYSRTLPHRKPEQPHQLLQSHYRGNLNLNKSNTLHRVESPRPAPTPSSFASSTNQPHQAPQQQPSSSNMRNPAYGGGQPGGNTNSGCASPSHGGTKSPLQQSVGNTISSIPSATEVVRSALSRSSSQVSLNQLNKTINLLPNSPPAPSPMTPTHQLRPASPSLSPSPAPISHAGASKTLGHQHQPAHQQQQQQYLPGQVVLHGTRTVGRPPQQPQHQPHQQPQQHQQQPPSYVNPHASLMQHRMEQQAKVPNRNVASIREFNELDSLLRSLSPGAPGSVTTHITPGYSSKPVQASLGGYMPASQQPTQQQAYNKPNTSSDLYAKVQKQPSQVHQAQQQPMQQQQQPQRPAGPGVGPSTHQPFTIDVTDKKLDENCIERQRQDISEFETPIELLPSMDDYQNITKLNPVKNHYWYKPNMSRELAIHLLKDKPQGTFIVRDSTSFKGAYGLAVKVTKLPKNILASMRNSNGGDQSAEYIRHFLIEPTGSGVRLKGYANEPVFDNLPDLIYQHSLTELALPCKLIIPRADIEDPQFNRKQKQFFDDFIASKEQAKHQPYERTSPDGGYRRYPGDVLVHNEHRIIFQ